MDGRRLLVRTLGSAIRVGLAAGSHAVVRSIRVRRGGAGSPCATPDATVALRVADRATPCRAFAGVGFTPTFHAGKDW